MKKLLCLLLTLSLFSCGVRETASPISVNVARVGGIFEAEVTNKYCYKIYGVGAACPEKLNGYLYSFATWEKVPIEQAEKELRDMYDRLLTIVNEDESIRSYLAEWPLSGRNTCVDIMFFDLSFRNLRRAPEVAVIGIQDGKMYKYYAHPETGSLMYENEYQKYLEERGGSTITPEPKYSGSTYDAGMQKAIKDFLRQKQ